MDAWLLVLAFLFVLANGFFVAAEFAIVKVRSTQITELADQGSVRAKMAKKLIRHLDAYLSATQLGITLASLGLGWLGEPALAVLVDRVLGLFGVEAPPGVAHTIEVSVAVAVTEKSVALVAQLGISQLLWFMAVLSINLGMINLFPVPMLFFRPTRFWGVGLIIGVAVTSITLAPKLSVISTLPLGSRRKSTTCPCPGPGARK